MRSVEVWMWSVRVFEHSSPELHKEDGSVSKTLPSGRHGVLTAL